MASESIHIAAEVHRKVKRIQRFTIAWMTIEAALSLSVAFAARSPGLLGFGGDSVIELQSAGVVYCASARMAQVARSRQQLPGSPEDCSSLGRHLW